jgi:hypothetical protein
MRYWRLLLISIFIIAILSTSSLAAIRTVTYYSSLFADSTPPGEFVDWTDNFTFPYFDPAMGELISVYFTATLNATLNGAAENRALTSVQNAYFDVDAYMDAVMINGQHIPLQVYLRVPEAGGVNVTAYDGVLDFLGTSSFNGSDANDTWGYVYYDDSANTTDYLGAGTFPLLAYTRASSRVVGGGSWYSLIDTLAWSNASITYTYDDARCISGYKKDGCTGLPLSGWNITVSNATTQWNATTDASGFWQICRLENDNYTVCEVMKPGWAQTSSPVCYTVTLAGINITNLNFTNQWLYCISGYKKDNCGDSPLAGWNITIINSTGYSATDTTGTDGKYEFCGLAPGNYTLDEELKQGWMQVIAPPEIVLNCSNITNQNFTNQKLLCISGYKLDECSKAGIEDWLITLNNSSYTTSNLTGSDGKYEFCNLVPGRYTLTEETKDGYISSGPISLDVTLPCGSNLTDRNFTNQALLCISGHKMNTCGQFNLSNWTIVLTNSLGGAMSALTNDTGYYQFCGLAPGIYNLSEESKEGWSPVSAPEQVTLNCSNISGMDFVNSECCGSSLKINKTADFGPSPANPAGVNQAINYTIIVENTGNETLYQVNVTDDKLGLREQIASLLPGEFRIFNARYVVAEIDLCGNITNIAWANATDPCSETLHVNASWTVPTSYTAAIEIDKRADVSSARIGDILNYTYTVTNTGDVNLSGLEIEDDRLGMIDERV